MSETTMGSASRAESMTQRQKWILGTVGVLFGVLPFLILAPLGGLKATGASYSVDKRLTITTPREAKVYALPVHLQWRTQGLDVGKGLEIRTYAVFIDGTPMAPGKDLRSLADDACKSSPTCPDQAFLSRKNIYLTDQPELDVSVFPQPAGGPRDGHEATIVLLDSSGRRIGESAWTVSFIVKEAEPQS